MLGGLEHLLVFEELEPVVERELLRLCGARKFPVEISGKLTHNTSAAGENSIDIISRQLTAFLRETGGGDSAIAFTSPGPSALSTLTTTFVSATPTTPSTPPAPSTPTASAAPSAPSTPSTPAVPASSTPSTLPARPPVLCAGCPHRASFLAVKRALGKQAATWGGDIGCYTLGNAWPLDTVDTCVCMGAGFTVPQGMSWVDPEIKHLGFVGDSTFFASGISGVINAVYNHADVTLFVLDNATTAMTGAQQHPGTGVRMSYDASPTDAAAALSIPAILRACGVQQVAVCDPFDFEQAIATARTAIEYSQVSAVVFRAPCITLTKPATPPTCDESTCTMCSICTNQLGCPALTARDGRIVIETGLCTGCNLCTHVCPFDALRSSSASAGDPR
jgi:indolepyruvate ferredoxin oxidoreductase alpha subunit